MIHFIVNTKSGKGKGRKALKKLSDYCHSQNIDFSTHITAKIGHATELARTLNQAKAENIVAVGGDGTFSEVLNGIEDFTQTTLGFIPAGRGNDYAKAAKLNLNPIKALKDILKGETVQHDYLEVSGKRCLNVAGTGIDVAVLERADGKSGKITYLKSLLHCLKYFKPFQFKVTVNGEESHHDTIMIGVCNGVAIGSGLTISPLSKIDDGKLNLVVVGVPQDGKLLKALLKFKKGKHIGTEFTTHIVCDEVLIEPLNTPHPIQIDGEIYHNMPLHCKIVAGGLKTFKVNKE